MMLDELEMKRLLSLIEVEKDKVRRSGANIQCTLNLKAEQVMLRIDSKPVARFMLTFTAENHIYLHPINFTYPFRGHSEESINDMREQLANFDIENWDSQTQYDVALDGTYGWNNCSDEEVIDNYNEYFGE